jgi:dihydrofolate reductase
VISIVVARSSNGVIGRDGGLPWRLPSDLRRFRELTIGHAVVMGRRTFESLPDSFRPLPDRRNLVLSSDPDWKAGSAETYRALGDALEACSRDCFVIGGSVTYETALPLANKVYATEIETELDGDAYFPALAPDEWQCTQQSDRIIENDHRFSFCVYERAN